MMGGRRIMTRTSKFCFKTSLAFDIIRLFYLDVQSVTAKSKIASYVTYLGGVSKFILTRR